MDDGVGSNAGDSSVLTRACLEQQLALTTKLGVGFWHWDVQTGAVRSLSGANALLGDGFDDTPMTTRGWAGLFHPDGLAFADRV